MPETHINAYYADVEDKKQAVFRAQGELQAAQDRLREKERQEGIDTASESAPSEPVKPAQDSQPKQSVFSKKK